MAMNSQISATHSHEGDTTLFVFLLYSWSRATNASDYLLAFSFSTFLTSSTGFVGVLVPVSVTRRMHHLLHSPSFTIPPLALTVENQTAKSSSTPYVMRISCHCICSQSNRSIQSRVGAPRRLISHISQTISSPSQFG